MARNCIGHSLNVCDGWKSFQLLLKLSNQKAAVHEYGVAERKRHVDLPWGVIHPRVTSCDVLGSGTGGWIVSQWTMKE